MKMQQIKCLSMQHRMLAGSAKVQSYLKQEFINYTGVARITKSAMSGMGFHMLWLRLSRPEATHVERAQRGALCEGGFVEPVACHVRYGGPPCQGMVLEEVTLPRRGGLRVFSNGPRQRIVERGARIFTSWRMMA